MHRRSFLITAAAAWIGAARAETRAKIVVYKTPSCGCCGGWVLHLRRAGFEVTVRDLPDLARIKQRAAIPESLQSCHTAFLGDYLIEGHVPAEAIARLVSERPVIRGIAVPGMPIGSPGMEVPGARPEAFDVMAVSRAGPPTVFASYPDGYRERRG